MLVARAQLDFVTELVARFASDAGEMRPVVHHQSQYIAIIALLRSVGHVFEKVDCTDPARRAWCAARWVEWKRAPIFHEFIEPARNVLLKEFQGGLQLRDDAFGHVAVVVDAAVPGYVSRIASFDARKLYDARGRAVLPMLRQALSFWDVCLSEAEARLPPAAS